MIKSFSPEALDLQREFEALLYYESSLISSHQIGEWTDLLHNDIRYWIPVRINRAVGDEDLRRPNLICHIDDDRQTLGLRAKRIAGGFGFADNPPPRLRHFVTNIRVLKVTDGCAEVSSNFLVWRSHVGLPDHQLVGARNDRWTRTAEGWLLLERQVVLDQDVVQGISSLI